MCRLPMTRAPASGFLAPCCARSAIRPGISCSARRISLRPNSACERSFTLKGSRPAVFAATNGCIFSVAVAICLSSTVTTMTRKHEELKSSSFSRLRVFVVALVFSPLRHCDEQSRTAGSPHQLIERRAPARGGRQTIGRLKRPDVVAPDQIRIDVEVLGLEDLEIEGLVKTLLRPKYCAEAGAASARVRRPPSRRHKLGNSRTGAVRSMA